MPFEIINKGQLKTTIPDASGYQNGVMSPEMVQQLSALSSTPAQWITGGKTKADHALNAGVKAANGELVIMSGKSDIFNPNPNRTIEIYNEPMNAWRYGLEFPGAGRYFPLIAALPNGDILIAGGRQGAPGGSGGINADFFDDSWLYHLAAGTWEQVGNLPKKTFWAARSWSVLANGDVIVSGGCNRVTNPIGTPEPWIACSDAYRYSFASKTWSTIASLNTARVRHKSILLDNGDVLVVGGQTQLPSLLALATVERYSGAVWSQFTMPTIPGEDLLGPGPTTTPLGCRTQMSVTKLTNGNVLICGGYQWIVNGPTAAGFPRQSSIIFNVGTNTFLNNRGPMANAYSVPMTIARGDQIALMRPDGLVQIITGLDRNFLNGCSCEAYDQGADSFTSTVPMPAKAVDSPTGTPLSFNCGIELDQAEVMNSGNIIVFANESTNFANGNRYTFILTTGLLTYVPYSSPAFNEPTRAARENYIVNVIGI